MPKTAKTKVLITGVGGPAGINIARLCKEYPAVHVLGCDIDVLAAGKFFVDEFSICPRVGDEDEYQKWIKNIVEQQQIDVLIPTVDEELLPLSRFVSELPCRTVLSITNSLEICSEKLRTYEFVNSVLPELCPRFISLSEWTPGLWQQKQYFIKPNQGRGARGCRVVGESELVWLAENTEKPDEFVVMEILPGTEWTVDAYIADDGSIAYLVPRERVGLAGGISLKGKTVKHQAVIDATKSLISELPMKGPVCIQWKQDESGKPKFIEVNPRLSGGLMISAAAGADPVSALLAECEGSIPPEQAWSEKTVVGFFSYQDFTDS